MPYTRTTWANGNTVTATLLNNIETGLTLLSTDGVVNVKDPAYGATGDGSTDDTTAIVAARNAVLNSRTGSAITDAPTLPILYFPPGKYIVTSPDVLLPTGGTKIAGYTIMGSGYETTIVSFQPVGGSSTLTNMNMMTAQGSAAPRLAGLRIKDICFESTNANASFAYLFSTTTAWVQATTLQDVRFNGTWKRIFGLDGDANSNLNSEMVFDRVVTSGATFEKFFHAGITTPGTFSQQDQFLNYWVTNCKFEQASGDTFVLDKGGHLTAIGGSWIIGNSGSGTHFKMGDYSHFDSVQFLRVQDARFELRNTNSRVIDCAWRGGHVVFDHIDDESQGGTYQINGTGAGTANFDTHIYRTPQNSGPIIRYQSSALMGYHRVVTTATVPTTFKLIYDGNHFYNMQGGGASLLSSATNQFLRHDSAAPHYRYVDNRFTTDVNA